MKEQLSKRSIVTNSAIEVMKDIKTHDIIEIREYIKKTYPDVMINDNTFNALFASSRKKGALKNLRRIRHGCYQMTVQGYFQMIEQGRYQITDLNIPEESPIYKYYERITAIEESFNNIIETNKNRKISKTTTKAEFIYRKATLESIIRLKEAFIEEKKQLVLEMIKTILITDLENNHAACKKIDS